MIRQAHLLLISFALAVNGALDGETYSIKIRESRQGDKLQTNKQSTDKSTFKIADTQGNLLNEVNQTVVEKFTYQQTILEQPAGKKTVTRLSRSYDQAEITKGEDKRALPYQGKTVLVERKGDKYHFQIDGGEELTGEDAKSLDKEFNQNKEDGLDFTKIILPKKPVRVQESWELDTQALRKDLEKTSGVEVDASKVKATAKLLKAYKKDGHQFGVVQIHLDFPIKVFKMDDLKITLDSPASFVAEATIDACIDGSIDGGTIKSKFRMEGQGELVRGEKKLKVSFKNEVSAEESAKEFAVK